MISLDSMGEIYGNTKNSTSSHYGIDSKGNIAVFVDEDLAAMSLSSLGANNRSISIQVSASTSQKPYPLSLASQQALKDLIVDICIRQNIKELKWLDDEKLGQTAGSSGSVAKQNVLIHKWFDKSKTDPGQWVEENLVTIVSEINEQLKISRENMRRIILIGDERATRMHNTIGTDLNLWFTKNGASASWIKYKKLPFESEINQNSAVCIIGGWSDLNFMKPEAYARKINEYARAWISVGCPVYYVSVTQVGTGGFKGVTNTNIERYNNKMKEAFIPAIGYIDAFSSINGNYVVTDGVHYDENTNKLIYSTIISTASRMIGGVRMSKGLNLDPTNFHPYIAKFNRDANVNYKQLRDLKVVGAIIEAGYRFKSNGTRTDVFDNPNIKEQIKHLDKYEIPYGMYTVCNAKTVDAAKIEMEYFQYQLYRHPPKMGAWIDITNFGNVKKTNDKLLKQYNQSLFDLGFKGRMGIIATRKVLKNIDWDNWQNEFYLYLVDHLTDLEPLDNILDPQLFDVDGKSPVVSSVTGVLPTTTTTDDTKSTLPSVVATGANAVTRAAMIQYAETFLGTDYKYGGNGMNPGEPLDCGQFVRAVYHHFGMDFSRSSIIETAISKGYGKEIKISEAQPGDVLRWPGHIAIYHDSEGQKGHVIHATSTSSTGHPTGSVRIDNIWSGYRCVNIIDYWKK